MSKLIFRMEYAFEIDGIKKSGIEEECSWYMVDQQGNVFEYGPLEAPHPADKRYTKLIPLIKIGSEYLSVDEIEKRLKGGTP
jgi:hypothetical protein